MTRDKETYLEGVITTEVVTKDSIGTVRTYKSADENSSSVVFMLNNSEDGGVTQEGAIQLSCKKHALIVVFSLIDQITKISNMSHSQVFIEAIQYGIKTGRYNMSEMFRDLLSGMDSKDRH